MQKIDFNRYSPFRRPDWRHERVLQMINVPEGSGQGYGRCTPRDDEYVQKLRNFIVRYRKYDERARERLAYENGGLYWAYQLYERKQSDSMDQRRPALILESRILARQTDEQIAAELSTIPDVVEFYEALFFNVRDRLRSYDWIVDNVLMPALDGAADENAAQSSAASLSVTVGDTTATHTSKVPQFGQAFFDPTIKFFSYFGGSVVLDYVLTGFRRGFFALNTEELDNWFDKTQQSRLRQRSAMAAGLFQINRYNVMELFNTHQQMIAIEKSAASGEDKHNMWNKSLKRMLEEIPWATGDKGAANVKGTGLEPLDKNAAELRDSEVQLVAAGEKLGTIEEVGMLRLPPPRKIKAGQEDQAHATNAK